MRQVPVYTPFETSLFKGCRAFAWKEAKRGPWAVSIDLWWQRLDNKWMEVLSAVVLCAERHNKEHVSWQYSAYIIPWRDYPERKKGFGMSLFVTLIFLTFLKERILASSLLLWKILQPLETPEENCSSWCSRVTSKHPFFPLIRYFSHYALTWNIW